MALDVEDATDRLMASRLGPVEAEPTGGAT